MRFWKQCVRLQHEGGLVWSSALTMATFMLPGESPASRAVPDVQAFSWESAAPELQHAIDSLQLASQSPGIQVAIRQGDRLLWSGITGSTGDGRTPLAREHLFRIGGITKTFTAAVILQLADEGKLRLGDTVARWFPHLPNADLITVRHLLEHRSGIRELLKGRSFLARAALFPGHRFSSADVVEYLCTARPYSAPGTGFHYSNSNYVLLGAIAERLTDSCASSLIRTRLLEPLHLEQTVFLPDDAGRVPPLGMVIGHDRDYMPLPGSYRVNPDDHAWATLAFTSGAMASTADDLAIWIDALMHGAVLPDFDVAAATNVRDARNPAIPELAGYGLGLERLRIYGEDWFGHLGGFVGFGGAVLYAPRTDRTIAVLGNMSTFHGVGAVRAIARVLAYQEVTRPDERGDHSREDKVT